MNTVHGADYRKPDFAFGGFNMVAGRSARRTALSAVFWKRYREQYKLFVSPNVKSGSSDVLSALQDMARKYIRDEDRVAPLVETHRYKFAQILSNRKLSPTEVSGQLSAVCKDVQDTLRTQTYVWVGFSDFVQLCAGWIQTALSRNPDTFVTLADLHGIYLALRNEVQREASQLSEVRIRLLDLPSKFRQIAKVRCEKVAAKALGAAEAVELEVLSEYRRAELEYFEWFLACCRADATKNQLAADTNAVSELQALAQLYDQRFNKPLFESSSSQLQQTSLPACIFQDKNAPVDVSGTLTVSRGRYLLMMLEGVKPEADADGVRSDADAEEYRTVVELGAQAAALGPANPLKKITLDFSAGNPPKAYSDVFKVDNTNEWHDHFLIRHGNVAPITWGKLAEFSAAFQTFRPATPTADGQNIDAAVLDGRFLKVLDRRNCDSQGAWIGTLQLDSEIRTVIKKTYTDKGKPIHIWQQRAFAAVAQGAPQRSLLTLPEMLAFGVILGCVDEHTRQKMELGARGCTIRCEKAALALRVTPDEVALYFKHEGRPEREYLLVNVNTAWIAPLMAWIDGSFWRDVGMEAFSSSLVELERSILEKMSLTLGEEEFRQPLMALAAKVKELVHVDLC